MVGAGQVRKAERQAGRQHQWNRVSFRANTKYCHSALPRIRSSLHGDLLNSVFPFVLCHRELTTREFMPDTSHSPFGSRNPHYENPFSEPKKMHHKARGTCGGAHRRRVVGWGRRARGLRSVGPGPEQ